MLFCCHKSIFRVSRVVFEGKLRLKRLLIAFFFFDISLISQFSPHLLIFKIRLQIILHYKKGEKHTCDLPYWENDWSLVLGTQARHCEQWYSVLFWPRGIYKSVMLRSDIPPRCWLPLTEPVLWKLTANYSFNATFYAKRNRCVVFVTMSSPFPLPQHLQDFYNSDLKGKNSWLPPLLQ